MNLAEISKLPLAMQKAAMADQARSTAARERIMAQLGQPAKPVDMKLGHASFAPTPPNKPEKAKINPQWKALETSGKPYANMQRDGSFISVPVPPAIRYGPKVSESRMQQEVIRWFRDACYEWQLEEEFLMAIPNAAKRTVRNGGRMLAEGLRPGAPDLFLAVPRGDCAGFFVEMKTRDGVLSENQRLMLARLAKGGYATCVCRSTEEAKAAIRAYLNLPTPSKP